MEPTLLPAYDLEDNSNAEDEEQLIHEWRTEQLSRLGLPRILAETFADLVERGCSPRLALDIVR